MIIETELDTDLIDDLGSDEDEIEDDEQEDDSILDDEDLEHPNADQDYEDALAQEHEARANFASTGGMEG